MNIIAIVPAAGVGKRAASANNLPKQYRKIAGIPVLRLAVLALLAEPRINQIVVTVARGDDLAKSALDGLDKVKILYCGGPDRADTVRNTLAELNLGNDTWVLVHDAARPGLPIENLTNLIDRCVATGSGGLLALPVADTLKYADADNRSLYTVDRRSLWQAQTPQMFIAAVLHQALNICRGNPDVTDEASAIELSGLEVNKPLLVTGARENFKLTYPDDFIWFEKFIFNLNHD